MSSCCIFSACQSLCSGPSASIPHQRLLGSRSSTKTPWDQFSLDCRGCTRVPPVPVSSGLKVLLDFLKLDETLAGCAPDLQPSVSSCCCRRTWSAHLDWCGISSLLCCCHGVRFLVESSSAASSFWSLSFSQFYSSDWAILWFSLNMMMLFISSCLIKVHFLGRMSKSPCFHLVTFLELQTNISAFSVCKTSIGKSKIWRRRPQITESVNKCIFLISTVED